MSYHNFKLPGAIAAGNLSTSQFLAVRLTSGTSGFEVDETTLTTHKAIGVLQNKPESSGQPAEVITLGVTKAMYGGTVAVNDELGVNTSAQFVTLADSSATTTGLFMFATALEAGAANEFHWIMFHGARGRNMSTG